MVFDMALDGVFVEARMVHWEATLGCPKAPKILHLIRIPSIVPPECVEENDHANSRSSDDMSVASMWDE